MDAERFRGQGRGAVEPPGGPTRGGPRAACPSGLPACARMLLWRVPGLFVVNKPRGPSSFDVIRSARRELGARKIGHAGTLDPIADGVLVLGVGWATRALALFSGADKTYRVRLRLGERTDSFDETGRVLERRDFSGVTAGSLGEALARFRGEIRQVPPMFSALKRSGRPLYELARSGQTVERAARTVTVRRLELVRFAPPDVELELDCSAGTYVRSLVEDLGLELGTGAVVTALTRTRVGPFTLDEARELGRLLGPPRK